MFKENLLCQSFNETHRWPWLNQREKVHLKCFVQIGRRARKPHKPLSLLLKLLINHTNKGLVSNGDQGACLSCCEMPLRDLDPVYWPYVFQQKGLSVCCCWRWECDPLCRLTSAACDHFAPTLQQLCDRFHNITYSVKDWQSWEKMRDVHPLQSNIFSYLRSSDNEIRAAAQLFLDPKHRVTVDTHLVGLHTVLFSIARPHYCVSWLLKII